MGTLFNRDDIPTKAELLAMRERLVEQIRTDSKSRPVMGPPATADIVQTLRAELAEIDQLLAMYYA